MKKSIIGLLGASLLLTGTVLAAESNSNVRVPAPQPIAQNMQIKTPTVLMPTAKQTATEVFMEIDNLSQQGHNVVGATSPAADIAQIHDFIKVNGRNKMQQVKAIGIPGKSFTDLEQGGFHVMLIGLNKKLFTPGAKIPISLVFEDGSHLTTDAVVQAPKAKVAKVAKTTTTKVKPVAQKPKLSKRVEKGLKQAEVRMSKAIKQSRHTTTA